MKTIFLLVFVSFVVRPGNPLQCWKCNGCETNSGEKSTCRKIGPEENIDVACMTQKIHDRDIPDSLTIKKCVMYEKNQPFKCPDIPNTDTVSCDKCSEDYCNAGTNMKISLTTCLVALAIRFF